MCFHGILFVLFEKWRDCSLNKLVISWTSLSSLDIPRKLTSSFDVAMKVITEDPYGENYDGNFLQI